MTDAPSPRPPSAVSQVDGGAFLTTRWTQVLAAQGETPEAKVALSELCAAYSNPVYRFLRCDGRDSDAARELTQKFFARILSKNGFSQVDPERGRFRSFLLEAVKHFPSDLWARERTAKRGGGRISEVFAEECEGDSARDGGVPVAGPTRQTPDTYFDRQWAYALMERGFTQLSRELADAGKAHHFAILKEWLVGEGGSSGQAAAAQSLGMSEGAVKVAIHRLRKRYRELVRTEVSQTVRDPADADAELRYLVDVLSAI